MLHVKKKVRMLCPVFIFNAKVGNSKKGNSVWLPGYVTALLIGALAGLTK